MLPKIVNQLNLYEDIDNYDSDTPKSTEKKRNFNLSLHYNKSICMTKNYMLEAKANQSKHQI